MNNAILKYLQPHAVWQLVVLALLAVVTPLLLLMYQTSVSLQNFVREGRQITEDSVVLAQNGRNARAALIDMERIARQYFVIGDESLLNLFRTTSEQFLKPLHTMSTLLNSANSLQIYRTIKQQQLRWLKTLERTQPNDSSKKQRMTELIRLQQSTDQLLQNARDHSNIKLHNLGRTATQMRETILQWAVILVPVTATLMAVFTFLIVGPIKQINRAIRTLGMEEHKTVKLFGPTELVQLAEELNSLQERLLQVEKQKQHFLHHVSHELKTPLSSILEGTALLQEEVVGSLSRPQQEVIGLVNENGHTLQKLIENLLNFNQIHYQGKTTPTQFDVYALIEELVRAYWLPLTRKQQMICIGGPCITLTAQRPSLQAALDNLLSNAIAYGDEKGKIWIEWQLSDTEFTLQVTNTGDTIGAEAEALIFEPFFQGSVKRSGAVSGSGIGLAVARNCIETQGGCLKLVENRHNRVSFAICLPQRPDANSGLVHRFVH